MAPHLPHHLLQNSPLLYRPRRQEARDHENHLRCAKIHQKIQDQEDGPRRD